MVCLDQLELQINQAGTMMTYFYLFLQNFVVKTSFSKLNPVLLILDNNKSHILLQTAEFAKEQTSILLNALPHTSHQLQPLDKTVFQAFKVYYNRAINGWMHTNSGKTMANYNISVMENKTYLVAFVPKNIQSDFKSTRIFPFDKDILPDACFAPAKTTNRPLPSENIYMLVLFPRKVRSMKSIFQRSVYFQ